MEKVEKEGKSQTPILTEPQPQHAPAQPSDPSANLDKTEKPPTIVETSLDDATISAYRSKIGYFSQRIALYQRFGLEQLFKPPQSTEDI